MKLVKTLSFCALSVILATSAAFATDTNPLMTESQKETIADGLNSFSTALLNAAPQAATQQNVWTDAYIGHFPHFGAGISLGGTSLDMSGLSDAADALTTALASYDIEGSSSSYGELNFKVPDSFILPVMTLEGRIGGFAFPFDIGICAMMTNPTLFSVDPKDPSSLEDMSSATKFNIAGFDGYVNYIALGFDVRYSVLKENLLFPDVSVGAGYYYTKGAFGVSSSTKTSATISYLTTTQKTDAQIDLSYTTHVFFLQAQASKNFIIATPFAGLRAVVANTETTWNWSVESKNSEISELYSYTSDSGYMTAKGKSAKYKDGKWDFSGIQPQIFGGVGFNFLMFKTGLNLCTDLRSFIDDDYEKPVWSGSLTFHAQL